MNRLIESILKDVKPILEMTDFSDIAYIPAQLGVISPMLQSLGRIKKTWHVTFLENKNDSKVVNFEDMLKVEVKNGDLVHFFENVLHLTTLPLDSNVNLTQYLKEAFEQDIEDSYKEIKRKLLNLISIQPVLSGDLNFETFKSKFGVKGYSSSKNILIKFETFRLDVDNLIVKLKEKIGNDKGELDLLIHSIEVGESLSKYPVFRDYDYLIGSIVNSNFYDTELIYSIFVNMGYHLQESMEIVNNEKILEEIGAYRGIKTKNNTMYPLGGLFTPKFFNFLRDTIIDLV